METLRHCANLRSVELLPNEKAYPCEAGASKVNRNNLLDPTPVSDYIDVFQGHPEAPGPVFAASALQYLRRGEPIPENRAS